jgi:hypothetical protein
MDPSYQEWIPATKNAEEYVAIVRRGSEFLPEMRIEAAASASRQISSEEREASTYDLQLHPLQHLASPFHLSSILGEGALLKYIRALDTMPQASSPSLRHSLLIETVVLILLDFSPAAVLTYCG